jgi:hypothetical protein
MIKRRVSGDGRFACLPFASSSMWRWSAAFDAA